MASPPYHRARLVCGSFQSVEAAISSVAAIAVREAPGPPPPLPPRLTRRAALAKVDPRDELAAFDTGDFTPPGGRRHRRIPPWWRCRPDRACARRSEEHTSE